MSTIATTFAWVLSHLLASQFTAPDLDRFECIRDAYPDARPSLSLDADSGRVAVAIGGRDLTWDDGRTGKTLAEMLDAPDVQDTLAIPYPVGPGSTPPGPDEDPGRVRVTDLSHALYGGSPKAVRAALVPVDWMPGHGGRRLLFNGRHGAAAALQRVSDDLERLPESFHRYVTVTAGTFNWRRISGTERLSAHSHAIAIDIDVKYSHYWRWSLRREPDLPWRNAIPMEIVEVFERHGFIWGGKWHHYDTMHFEYRPELLHPSCVDDRTVHAAHIAH